MPLEKRTVTINNNKYDETKCSNCGNWSRSSYGVVSIDAYKCWDCWRRAWTDDIKFKPDDLNFSYDELQIIHRALTANQQFQIWIRQLAKTGERHVFYTELTDLQDKLKRIIQAIESAPKEDTNESESTTPYCC